MKLTLDNKAIAENKALILYILNKIGKPIESEYLLKLVLSISNMNYFYFQQFLLDLVDNKYVEAYTKNDEQIYNLTTEGKTALELVKDLIPGIVKFNVDKNFKETLGAIENELSISAEYIPQNENNYSVRCKIVENTQVLFDLLTYAGHQEQAKTIADNWRKNASTIYPKILQILIEDCSSQAGNNNNNKN